jgi:hypothetical protein
MGRSEPPTAERRSFKINLPGTGSEAGQGYDWVLIEEVKKQYQHAHQNTLYAVRPSDNPHKIPEHETAHFLKKSTMLLCCSNAEEPEVTASVHGRNELPNTGKIGRCLIKQETRM